MNIKKLKKTKIVCTIGPTSTDPVTLESMIEEGMNVARLNFSHGNYEEHQERIEMIKEARKETGVPIAIMLDTKGPEIRTGLLENGEAVELKEGQLFILTTEDIVGNDEMVSISYEGLPEDVQAGDIILIDDGLIALGVDKVEGNRIYCVVTNEGFLGERKGINVPGVQINLPGLTQKDKKDLLFGIEMGVDFVAASFVRKAEDVTNIRHVLDDLGGSYIKIIAKIESREGVSNFDSILKVSDGIMVARGDLGIEVPAQDVPILQKKFIQKCNKVGKPVITATQMLDSMIRNPRPTRAEVADVANAVFDGTDAVMLSGETANGEYPVQSVKTMAEIVSVAEVADEFRLRQNLQQRERDVSNAVCEAAITISVNLNSPAIIAATARGQTARALSKYKPDAIILATSFLEETIRQLSLSWGVYGILVERVTDSDLMVRESMRAVLSRKLLGDGDRIIIAAGIPVGISGTTNTLRVITVGETYMQGVPGGKKGCARGTARKYRVHNLASEQSFQKGDILIIPRLTRDFLYLAKQAGAILIEDEDDVNRYLFEQIQDIPYMTSVKNAFENIRDEAVITVDTRNGTIEQESLYDVEE